MEACVGLAIFGGGVMGSVGVVYIFLLMVGPYINLDAVVRAAMNQKFKDALLIISLAALPLAFLCGIPWIYRSPGDVPQKLYAPILMGGSFMIVCWGWAIFKIVGSFSARRRDWLTLSSAAILLSPAIVSSTAIAGVISGRIH